MHPQTPAPPCVRIVDDDDAVRTSLTRVLRAAGFQVCAFPSAQAFLAQETGEVPGCAVLDLVLPGQSGLELQTALRRARSAIPVIFLSGHADVPSSVRAMKAGAMDFLTKPLEAAVLIAAVQAALERDQRQRAAREERRSVARRLESLTPREREVLAELLRGRLNKQIAAQLGASEKTIKVHRARVLQKMGARSIADLVRMAERAAPADAAS